MLNWLHILIAAFIYTQLAIFVTTLYLHRGLAHRAVTYNPVVAFVFRAILWLTIGVVAREWVAVHRKHHTFTDKEEDPHSPLKLGFWKIQLGNYYYYRKEIANKETIKTFASDMPSDTFDKLFFNYGWLGVLFGITILVTILGFWAGLIAWSIHAVLYVFLSGCINGLCHWYGYKNFEDQSATNVHLLSYLAAGEGFHNNHHGKPTCPKFSMKWYEFDPAWIIISILTFLRLAKPMKTVKL